jgi:hypothetical protein
MPDPKGQEIKMRSKTRCESAACQRQETPFFAVCNLSACIDLVSQFDALPVRGTPRPAQANALNLP